MPLCVLNLGGEMMYILHQRLSAQDVDALEVARVLRMMIETLTHADFLDQLGKPQEVYGWVPMIAVFERLCTASSISLNETSFSKVSTYSSERSGDGPRPTGTAHHRPPSADTSPCRVARERDWLVHRCTG
jgi:hypothetical protein